MPLVKAKCTNCGASLEVNDSLEAAICPYCGTAYVVERAIHLHNTNYSFIGSVVNVYSHDTNSKAEIDRLLMQADTQIKFNEYSKAFSLYKRITNEYPEDYRGWVGLLNFIHSDLQRENFIQLTGQRFLNFADSYFREVTPPDILERIRLTVPNQEIYDGVKQQYNKFWRDVYQRLKKGEIKPALVIAHQSHGEVLNFAWDGYTEELTAYFAEIKQRTQEILNSGVFYGCCGQAFYASKSKVGWWPSAYMRECYPTAHFYISDSFVIFTKFRGDIDDLRGEIVYEKMSTPQDISPAFLDSLKKEALDNFLSLRVCPSCGRRIKRCSLFLQTYTCTNEYCHNYHKKITLFPSKN